MRGLTLLETLLATVILGLAIALLSTAAGRSLRQVSEARLLDAASLAARQKIGDLEKEGFPQDEGTGTWAPLPEIDRPPRPSVAGRPLAAVPFLWRHTVKRIDRMDPTTGEESDPVVECRVEIAIAGQSPGSPPRILLEVAARYPPEEGS